MLWDSSRGGEIDEYGEPAEIVFIHAGHEQAVIDCDWLADSYTAGSVDERGRLAIWRPAGTITEQLQDFVWLVLSRQIACDNIQCNNYFASEKDVVDSVQKDETL